MTIATGAEDRAVAGIERLIKRTIEVRTVDARRVSRGDRTERGERAERGERTERGRDRDRDRVQRDRPTSREPSRGAPSRPPAPADEFFSKPYEPAAGSAAEGAAPEAEPAKSSDGKKPAKVAALLGGRKH
jgi:hypothetical protein